MRIFPFIFIIFKVRRWLNKIQKAKQEARIDMIPQGLTDSRRVELAELLTTIRERFPVECFSNRIIYFIFSIKIIQYFTTHQYGIFRDIE